MVATQRPLPQGPVTLSDGSILTCDVIEAVKLNDALQRGHCPVKEVVAYRSRTGMLVLASRDQTPHGTLLHLSISYRNRSPSWGDIKRVKKAFFGSNRDAMMVLPKANDYINLHQYCFHLWEMPVEWGIR